MRIVYFLLLFFGLSSQSFAMSMFNGDAGAAAYPFPSNKGPGPFCQAVAGAKNEDAQRAYDVWKETLVTRDGANGFRRVVRPDTPDGRANSTVSEGISYAMILAVYFDDQSLFDDAFQYSQHWADETGLMQWYIDPTGTEACPGRDDCGAASDADEDIAFALIMADKQWGGQGALDKSYREYALRQIALVKKHEVHESGVFKPGNKWGGPEVLNLSYFAPAFFKVFGEYSNDEAFWNNVIDVNYKILFDTLNEKNGNQDNGLVPAWSNVKGEPVVAFPGALTYFQTDSIRTPFRIAQHYCWTGDERAKAYLDKVNSFFPKIGAGRISDGYLLDGTPNPEVGPLEKSASAVFVACTGVAAMAGGADPVFVKGTYDLVQTLELNIRSTSTGYKHSRRGFF